MMNYYNVIAIFIGGGIGSMSRYALSRWVYFNFNTSFPYGTLMVNIVSCLILGIFIGYSSERILLSPSSKLFITVGFCGGFSTFSTFAFETLELLRLGQYLSATTNIMANTLACILSIIAGLIISKLF